MEQTNSPKSIARQTLLQLAKRNQEPTPDNYLSVYNEIAGISATNHQHELINTVEKVLMDVEIKHPRFDNANELISALATKKDIAKLENELRKLIPSSASETKEANWPVLIRTLLKKLEFSHKGITLSRKKEGLSRVLTNFSKDPNLLAEKIQSLMLSWGSENGNIDTTDDTKSATQTTEVSTVASSSINTENLDSHWQKMMIKAVEIVLIPNFKDDTDSLIKAETLLTKMQQATTEEALAECYQDLKSVMLTFELQRDDQLKINQSMINLMRLLIKSMNELTDGDKWLKGQMAIVEDIISKPLNVNTLYDAESSIKDLIYKQLSIKPAVEDSTNLLKQMAETFINRLIETTESTSDYHDKIETHLQNLSSAEGIDHLNTILKDVLEDTRSIGVTVQRTRDEFDDNQKKVLAAEKKIQALSAELDHISEVAQEDYLTGTLNRRGMDEALEREFSRADRYKTDLSIAMMDIDHFKKLNDKFGHATGDEALTFFAGIIKKVKRTTDVLARYGGEEFIIILPATKQKDAVRVIQRVQRALTKEFFMGKNEKVLITFSAGVAERAAKETVESIIPRADAALYEAKTTGRNRVVGAAIQPEKPEI